MSTQDEKLAKFRKAVFAEADKQAAQILADIGKHRQEELDKTKDEALELHFRSMQKQLNQIKQDCKRDVSKADLAAKRELLTRREELCGQVFAHVRERLREFTSSAEYKSYLLDKIAAAFKSCPAKDSVLYLTASDLHFQKDLQSRLGFEISVQEMDNDKIGGFLLKNEPLGIAVDETLDSLLESQRDYFSSISHLKVD